MVQVQKIVFNKGAIVNQVRWEAAGIYITFTSWCRQEVPHSFQGVHRKSDRYLHSPTPPTPLPKKSHNIIVESIISGKSRRFSGKFMGKISKRSLLFHESSPIFVTNLGLKGHSRPMMWLQRAWNWGRKDGNSQLPTFWILNSLFQNSPKNVQMSNVNGGEPLMIILYYIILY